MVEKMDQTRAKVIHRKLAQVARIERLVWLARTVAVLVAYAAAIGACHFALDWSWRPSAGPRSILLAGLLLAVGYLLWREVLLPLKRLPTREDVALEIERFFPPLGGRFISSYQLSQRPAGGSPQLIAQLIEETSRAIGALNFRAVSDRKSRNRSAGAAAVVLLGWIAFVGLTATGWMSFPVWLTRLLDPFSNAEYPTKTMVRIAKGDLTVARGEDVELRAHADGLIPAGGSIWIRRGEQRAIEQPVSGSGREFVFVQKSAVESFAYYWRLGDGRSPEFHVTVIIPPQVRAILARYDYPAYTRRPPETAYGGNLEGLPGTKVTLAVRTNKPITKGVMLMDNGREVSLAPLAETTDQGQDARATTYTAALDIGTSRSAYRVRLVDDYGFENKDPMEYAITPLPDEAPHVELRNIEDRKFVTPYAALPVEIHCRDDYGVARVQLHLSIAGAKEEIIEAPARANERDVTLSHTLRFDKLDLKPGAELFLWASALDNCAIGKPHEGFSGKVRLDVVSPEEMVRLMRERMESLFPRLEQIGVDAIESKTAIEDILRNGKL
jgi:hypothetical protein